MTGLGPTMATQPIAPVTTSSIEFTPVAKGLLLPEGPVAMADGSVLLSTSGGLQAGPAARPVHGIVDRKSRGVEVALKFEASLFDEVLVFRIVVDGGHSAVGIQFSQPAQIHIHEGVGAGQQPGRFRWRVLPQLHRDGNRRSHNHHRQHKGERASDSHEMRLALK